MTGTAYRHNPYTLPVDRWTDDKVAARRDMPTNGQGHIVQPRFQLRDDDVRLQTARWRAWSERWPQHLWPTWCNTGWRQTRHERTTRLRLAGCGS